MDFGNEIHTGRGRRRGLFMILAGALSVLPAYTPGAAAQVFLKPEEALSKLMPEAETFVRETKAVTPEADRKIRDMIGKPVKEKEFLFVIGMAGGGRTGYAMLLNMIGKERPITFMVVINPDGAVRAVEVLVYRESQGSEIRSRGFMKQFEGKTVASPLRSGRDIDAVSGATLSSRSAAYVVKKALALASVFYGLEGGLP